MSYNKEIDYQAQINEAVKNKDYKSAAELEKNRNEKIETEKLPYEKTNRYSGWLDNTDYSIELRKQMAQSAPKRKVASTLKSRVDKASGTDGLSHYAYDSVYDEAIEYLLAGADFSYEEKRPVYEDKYSDEIKALYEKIKELAEFDYDPDSDKLYRYYKAQYNREGKRAMEDLLGELSMNTGGVPSSYAVSAAGQMLENYNSKLTDIIPELYNDAYERHLDSIGLERENLETLAKLSDKEYDRYLKELDSYYNDRDFSYGVYADGLERDFIREKFDQEQEIEREKLDNENKEREQEEKQTAIDNALDKWEALGYLDGESAKILGLPEGLHTSDYDYKKAQEYKLYKK